MSIERTREVMSRYWDSDHTDLSVMADDVVFTHMASGDEHRGPEAVRGMLDYMYRQAFDARAEFRSRICTADQAVVEGEFVGRHIGEFAGIPPTGRSVRELVQRQRNQPTESDRIKRARVYIEMPVLLRQLAGAGEVAEAVSG